MENKSTELNELFSAMSLAQSEIKVAIKDSSNPFFKSSYANLQSIIEASRPALCKNKLSVLQQITSEEGQDYLVTMLCHASGQWISSRMRITPAKQDVQSLGSYITYLRRYSYASLIGVYDGQEDDDGNAAVQESTIQPLKLVSEKQAAVLISYMQNNPELREAIYKQYGVKSVGDIKESDGRILIEQLSK